MFDLNDAKQEIHDNAVKHGWWEKNSEGQSRTRFEVVALIHSEWSEALESYRNGEQMVWVQVDDKGHNKPEGVFVELIDGVIRILDAAAAWDILLPENISEPQNTQVADRSLPNLVCWLHDCTSMLYHHTDDTYYMMRIINMVWAWITAHGGNPEGIMREKHEYNKTRSYKHGGKVI